MQIEMDVLTDTLLHVNEVKAAIEVFNSELTKRGILHDSTKLQEPEFSPFCFTRERFKKVNYGTPEYQALVDEIKPSIEHHYKHNRHHTAHHANGIDDMNLIDIIEMISDWKAAERRSPDKKLADTLDYAFEKYKIDVQLGKIITNTLKSLGWI